MAENQKTVFKSVQELANENQVPEKYIHTQGSVNSSCPMLNVPVVDLRLLTSTARKQELNKLQSGLKFCGCIQVWFFLTWLVIDRKIWGWYGPGARFGETSFKKVIFLIFNGIDFLEKFDQPKIGKLEIYTLHVRTRAHVDFHPHNFQYRL